MMAQIQRVVGTALAMSLWFGMVHWVGPVIGLYPVLASRLNIILVMGIVAFMFYYRCKTTNLRDRKLMGHMLAYAAAGIVVSLATDWALHRV